MTIILFLSFCFITPDSFQTWLFLANFAIVFCHSQISLICLMCLSLWNLYFYTIRSMTMSLKVLNKVNIRALTETLLSHCDQNHKVHGSNPTRCLTGLRDPILLWGSLWPLGQIWMYIKVLLVKKHVNSFCLSCTLIGQYFPKMFPKVRGLLKRYKGEIAI